MAEHPKLSIPTLTSEHANALSTPEVRELARGALVLMLQGGYACGVLVDNVPIGFGAVTAEGELMLYLLPAYQRQGYGSIVLRSLVENAFARGATCLHAKARTGSGGAALALKVGFMPVRSSEKETFFEMKRP